jgi:transglutaminase-like putative cysteine protease
MNSRRNLGLVAGAATLLAAAPLSGIFASWTWLVQCVITVAAITGTATLARSMRAPAWAQGLAMSVVLLFVLTWFYPNQGNTLALIPTPDTFAWFGELLRQALDDVRSYGVPVPDRPGLIFLTVFGVGAVAILVDIVTVSLRRPALAGLPMLAIYSVPVAVYTENTSPVPFVIGASGFLWLLVADNVERVRRFGRRFTGDGRDIDAWEPSPLAAAGRRLALVGVLLAVALPLATPDLGLGLVDRFTGTGGDGTGDGPRRGAGSVDLFAELNGKLTQSETYQMLKVTTNEPDPYYLRFGVADQVTAGGFRGSRPQGRSVPRALGDQDPRDAQVGGVNHREYTATVQISDRFDMPLLPFYLQPIRSEGIEANWFYDSDGQVVFSNTQQSVNMTYKFDYVRSKYSPSALRGAKPLPGGSEVRRAYTVPSNRAVDELVDRLTADADNDYDRVRAIHDSFSTENGFTYSLETEPGTSGSDIVDFLENKTGFCEQYAAAMAWMVRAAGIPARVAFGFTNGNNRAGNTFTLTNRNLHSWTEVYFSGFGWVPFDATPTANVAGSVVSAWAPDPNQPEPTDPAAAPSGAPAGPGDAPSAGPNGQEDEDPGGAGAPIPTPNATTWPWWTLGAVLVTLMVLAVPALRRAALRRRRRFPLADATVAATPGGAADRATVRPVTMTVVRDPAQARADAHAAWDELLDTMIDFRVSVDPTETPRSTIERLVTTAALTGPTAEGARLLGRAEERARYAREPLATDDLADGLRAVRRALADAATRRERLTAALMPPSVLLRWRMALIDAGTATVLGGGRLRDQVGRLNPRRRIRAARAAR